MARIGLCGVTNKREPWFLFGMHKGTIGTLGTLLTFSTVSFFSILNDIPG